MVNILFITGLAVVLSIGLHFATLLLTTKIIGQFHGTHPSSILISLLFAVLAHLFEILIFAKAFQVMLVHELITFSIESPDFLDLFYFSGTTYTTLGYGDIVLVGDGRILAVIESLMGLVLIAWTASFTYFEMNRKWIRQG